MQLRARSVSHFLLAIAAVSVLAGSIPSAQASVSSGSRAIYVPITPCRLFDTRPAPSNVGTRVTPIGPGEIFTLQVRGSNGNCNIPAEAVGVAMNTTAVNGTASSYLTVYPADAGRPLASSLNWSAGQGPSPNQLNVTLAADGRISMFNFAGAVDVLGDIVGYYEDHNFDDRYYTKAQIDQHVTTKILSFPAESLNDNTPGTLIRSGGLNWPYDASNSADLVVHRPSDYVLNTAVTLKLFFRPSTSPPAATKVQFFARPRDYNSGDPFLDPFDTTSDIVSLGTSSFTYYETTITFPQLELNKDWWQIVIARNSPITSGFTGVVIVMSAELSYTGYTSQG